MKFKNKILAGLMAVVLAFGVLGLPVYDLAKSLAVSASVSVNTLTIKDVDKVYDISENNYLIFSDYCEDIGAVGTVYAPNGEVLQQRTISLDGGVQKTGVYFNSPGLYALQFKLNETSGFDIYSDVIYIPVSYSGLDVIELDGTLNSTVKPGSTVTIPMPIDENWEEDTSVTIKVYTANGDSVVALQNSITRRWSFTNIEGVLGNYYVEYSKSVPVGNTYETVYAYEIVKFAENATKTEAITYHEKEEAKETDGEKKISISSTGLTSSEGNLYLYKFYNLSNAVVQNADGSTDGTATIYVSIYDEHKDVKKFYNFNTGMFDIATSANAKFEVGSLTNVSFKNIEHVTSGTTGHTLRFTFSATTSGTEQVDDYSVSLTEKVDLSKVYITPATLVPNEITDITLVETLPETVTASDLKSVVFDNIQVTADNGYDIEAIKELVTEVKMQVTPSGKDVVVSTNSKDSNGIGFEVVGTEELEKKFRFIYNKNLKTETTWTVEYFVTFSKEISATNEFSSEKHLTYTVYLRDESQDRTAPSSLTIGSYPLISTDGKFEIPTATAKDFDDMGKESTGVKITATISGGNISVARNVEQGEVVDQLEDGTYKVEFIATDANGNRRVKTISFKVKSDEGTTVPSLIISAVNFDNVDGVINLSVSGNADSATIYVGDKAQVSPNKITYANRVISALEFNYEAGKGCVVVFSKSNDYATTYVAVKLYDGAITPAIASVGYEKYELANVNIVPNTTVSINTFDTAYWFGANNFEIEAPEGALYEFSDGNEFVFYTAGTYTIKSVEVREIDGVTTNINAITTLTVGNAPKTLQVVDYLGGKMIADIEQDEEKEMVLNAPVVVNYHGYTSRISIKNSTGHDVTDSNISYRGTKTYLVPNDYDEYVVEHTFTAEGITKQVYSTYFATGKVSSPVISISDNNANEIWNGEKFRYEIKGAAAVDKNGKNVAVAVTCYDSYGQALKVVNEDGKNYVEINGAGFYTVYYTAVDEEGAKSVVTSIFAIEFPEEEDEDGLSAWAVIGIVFASIVGACLVAGLVLLVIKYNKKKTRFINKAKQEKKKEKQEVLEKTVVYTIAESKDEKHWLLKNGNRTIAKLNSKQDAIDKAKEVHKKGEFSIKVYNKNGRLIDSI